MNFCLWRLKVLQGRIIKLVGIFNGTRLHHQWTVSEQGAKILFQSTKEYYRTTENPSYILGYVVQSPPGTFGFMGIEEMHFQPTVLIPSAYFNTTLKITRKPYSPNTLDVSLANIQIGQTTSIASTKFTSNIHVHWWELHFNIPKLREKCKK